MDTQASLVQQYVGTVKSDQANVDTFKLDLVYARITAPVSGRVGLRQVDPGNYVTTGDTNGVVVITQLQPISVIFTTSEDNLTAILKPLHAGTKMSVTAYDRANTQSLESGYLETVDNQIDTTTGTVKARATFDNKNDALFPNQFVNTRLLVNTLHGVTLIPTSAIQQNGRTSFVFVIQNNIATMRTVNAGVSEGEVTQVEGISPGDVVANSSFEKLQDKSRVTAAHAAAKS